MILALLSSAPTAFPLGPWLVAAYVYTFAFWLLLPATAIYAFVRGGRPEREAACCFLLAGIASLGCGILGADAFRQVETGMMIVDVALFVALAVLVARFDRWWLIWAAAFQGVAMSSHLGRWQHIPFDPAAYAIMESFSAYPTLALLAYATWMARRHAASTSSASSPRPARRASRGGLPRS